MAQGRMRRLVCVITDNVSSGVQRHCIYFFLGRNLSILYLFSHVFLFFPHHFLPYRAKLGHGLLSGQYSKPPMKSELIEQVMKEEHKVFD